MEAGKAELSHRKVHLRICSALNSSQTQKVARGCRLSEPSVRLAGKSSIMIRPSTWPWEFMEVERCRQPNMLASVRKHRFASSGCAQFTEGAGTAKDCGRKEPLMVPKLVIKTNTVCASGSTLFSSMGREGLTSVAGSPVLREKRGGYRADCLELMGVLREVQGRMIWRSLLSFILLGLPSPAEFA